MVKSDHILITGGSGFVGTHLIKYLKKRGYKNLTVVDVVPPKVGGVNFVKSNFYNLKAISKILKKTDCVFHLAAMVGVDRCRLDPKKVHKINNIEAKKFIDLCVKNGVKRFIFSSSSEVYGNSKNVPYKEGATLHPISEYAKSKVAVEKYLKRVQQKSNMTIGIVRFFNVYGPGQRKDFVMSIFVDRTLRNKPLTILGDGKQTRCFTFVGDAIKGLFKLLKYKSKYEIFNIGSTYETSINDLTKIILKHLPK
jgi:UDP-glucose 4-epimerase